MNTYIFRNISALINCIHALCKLSCGVKHCPQPLVDFSFGYSVLMRELRFLRKIANGGNSDRRIYLVFHTTGFEFTTMHYAFEGIVDFYRSSVLSCYSIQFCDGYYQLENIDF